MDPTRLLRLCGTLTKRTQDGTRDANDELVVTTTTETVRCWVQPSSSRSTSDEDAAGQNTTVGRWIGYFPAGVTIEGWDKLTVGGIDYEFVGPAQPWTHPRTGTDVYQAAGLERIR